MDLLPAVMGENERHMVLSKADGRTDSITINKKMYDGTIENELKAGNYDVEIDTGPSFAVQKEVSLEFMQETMAANPQVFPLIADLWAGQLDVQQMPLIKERLKI